MSLTPLQPPVTQHNTKYNFSTFNILFLSTGDKRQGGTSYSGCQPLDLFSSGFVPNFTVVSSLVYPSEFVNTKLRPISRSYKQKHVAFNVFALIIVSIFIYESLAIPKIRQTRTDNRHSA